MKESAVIKKRKKAVSPVIVVIYVFLVLLAVLYLAPLLWMLSVSLKDNAGVMAAPFALPETFHLENYTQAWSLGKLGTALVNSTLVCGVTLLVSLFFGAMAAFAIARMRWKLAEAAHTFFLIGMMVPVHCILIPLFVRFAKLGLTNSRFGLMLPYITFSLPMTIFLLTGFFKSMPGELIEAAAIDGCGIYRIFFKIALPLAMVFISDPAKKTLPVTLTYFVGPYATNYVQMFAAIIIAIAPTVIVYCLFSNQIVEGLTTGAVKG